MQPIEHKHLQYLFANDSIRLNQSSWSLIQILKKSGINYLREYELKHVGKIAKINHPKNNDYYDFAGFNVRYKSNDKSNDKFGFIYSNDFKHGEAVMTIYTSLKVFLRMLFNVKNNVIWKEKK